jgi:hypothetical protein
VCNSLFDALRRVSIECTLRLGWLQPIWMRCIVRKTVDRTSLLRHLENAFINLRINYRLTIDRKSQDGHSSTWERLLQNNWTYRSRNASMDVPSLTSVRTLRQCTSARRAQYLQELCALHQTHEEDWPTSRACLSGASKHILEALRL